MILYVHAPADDTSTPPGTQPSHHVLRLMAILELTFELTFYIPLRGVATAGDTGDASPVRPTMSPYIILWIFASPVSLLCRPLLSLLQ